MGEYFKDYFTQIFADKNTDGRGKKICVNRREINQRKSARENSEKVFRADGRRLKTQMDAEKKRVLLFKILLKVKNRRSNLFRNYFGTLYL
jgi:hypothetical protein